MGRRRGRAPHPRRAAVRRAADRAWALLDNPGPLVSDGRVVKGPDGEPLPDAHRMLRAVDWLLRISERRARLLGLDAPARVAVESTDAIDAEIERLATRLAQGLSPDRPAACREQPRALRGAGRPRMPPRPAAAA